MRLKFLLIYSLNVTRLQNLERSKRTIFTTLQRKICFKKEIILGYDTKVNQNEIINPIILKVKYYIYVCKLENQIPLLIKIKNRLKITESIENKLHTKLEK